MNISLNGQNKQQKDSRERSTHLSRDKRGDRKSKSTVSTEQRNEEKVAYQRSTRMAAQESCENFACALSSDEEIKRSGSDCNDDSDPAWTGAKEHKVLSATKAKGTLQKETNSNPHTLKAVTNKEVGIEEPFSEPSKLPLTASERETFPLPDLEREQSVSVNREDQVSKDTPSLLKGKSVIEETILSLTYSHPLVLKTVPISGSFSEDISHLSSMPAPDLLPITLARISLKITEEQYRKTQFPEQEAPAEVLQSHEVVFNTPAPDSSGFVTTPASTRDVRRELSDLEAAAILLELANNSATLVTANKVAEELAEENELGIPELTESQELSSFGMDVLNHDEVVNQQRLSVPVLATSPMETDEIVASSLSNSSALRYGGSSSSFSEIPQTPQMSSDLTSSTSPLQESPPIQVFHFLPHEDSPNLAASSTSFSFVSNAEANEATKMELLQLENSDNESDVADAVQPPPPNNPNSKRTRPDTDTSFVQVKFTYIQSFNIKIISAILSKQDAPCWRIAPLLPKCRECWNAPQIGQQRENERRRCRFYGFRRLVTTKSGQLAVAGFLDPFL